MTVQRSFDFAPAAPTPDTRRNLVIEAGAGTGKTTAIVAEVLELMLAREDLNPERIVLVTFTEKAAGEIADRIRMALEELAEDPVAWPVDSPHPLVVIDDVARARRAIAHHLANIDSLRSQTIHSFCQSLLRTFPIEAGLDPQFKIIEGFERSLLHGEVYDAWLDKETRSEPTEEGIAEWELLFTHVGYLFQIRDLVLALVNRRDLLAETAYDFGAFEEVLPDLEVAIHAIRNSIEEGGDDATRKIVEYVRSATSQPDGIDAWIAWLQPIAASIRDANLPRKGVLKDALKILRAGDKGRSIHDRLVSHRAAMALLALTRRFISALDAEKRRLGVVDFDDLLLRTADLLEDPVVLERARAQFDFIFVDEFQDTDRTQARILDRLARDASGGYVAGRTIVVGDPKQSIYGFRRADPETYHRMTEALVRGGAKRELLLDQYRSDAPLLEVVNAMFLRLFPEEPLHDPNVFRPAYHALQAARPSVRRQLDACVTLLHAEHEDKGDRHRVEAEAIANWIEAKRDGSALDLQRFAILFRRLTRLDDYLDTLEQHGIDYVLPPTRLFLEKRAPVDLLAVLRAIAWPFDRGAQISAARTPYFALTDVEIVSGGDAWTAFTASIDGFREASRHRTLSALIDLILETTSIEHIYQGLVDGTRHLRHLEHLRGIAFEYDQRVGGSVRQFVDEIAQRRNEPEETEPSLIDESQNAVRILSVHAAKGLEFDTVIIPDLAFPATSSEALQFFTVEEPRSIVLSGRADSISANFRTTADGEKLKKLSGQREEAELRRLFYVAVTRAKTDVVFVCNLAEDTRNVGFLKCLCEGLGVERSALAALWPAAGREVRLTPVGPVAFERIERTTTATARSRARLRDAALEAALTSDVLMPLEIGTPTPQPVLGPGEVAARRAGARNRMAGILLHRVLEFWDGRSDPEPLVQALAGEFGAEAESLARVRRRLGAIARSTMLERIAAAETIGRELPIRFVAEGTVVERRIDRLLRERDHDLVIDYKSGQPEPTRVGNDTLQVQRYCRAVGAITGRTCRGVLWYIDLDADVCVDVPDAG